MAVHKGLGSPSHPHVCKPHLLAARPPDVAIARAAERRVRTAQTGATSQSCPLSPQARRCHAGRPAPTVAPCPAERAAQPQRCPPRWRRSCRGGPWASAVQPRAHWETRARVAPERRALPMSPAPAPGHMPAQHSADASAAASTRNLKSWAWWVLTSLTVQKPSADCAKVDRLRSPQMPYAHKPLS